MDRIYEQHQAAFKTVEAWVILHGADLIGRVAFKRGASGKVWCYLHLFGITMTRGGAGGGGYDKASAAFYDATTRFKTETGANPEVKKWIALVQTAAKDGAGGSHWDRALRDAGFIVHQAV